MIQCARFKRSVLQVVPFVNIPAQKFHLTSKTFVRTALSKNFRDNAEEKHLKSVSDPVIPQNPNVNFLGIESEEGVITVVPKINSVQQNFVKRKLKEKFYSASFGVIRYDSDNKLKVHGQYGDREFVFPHSSTEYSELCRAKVSSVNFDTACNDSEKKHKLSNCIQNSSVVSNDVNDSETYGSNDVIEEDSCDTHSLVTEDQDTSYIDDYYFNNISKKENSVKNSNVAHPSTEELNFLDENYFGNFAVPENQRTSNERNYLKNKFFSEEVSSEYSDKKFSEVNSIKNIDGENLKSNYIKDVKLHSMQDNMSCAKSHHNVLKDTMDTDQLNIDIMSDTKYINLVNPDTHLKINQFTEETDDSFKRNSDSSSEIMESDLIPEENSKLRNHVKIRTGRNVQSLDTTINSEIKSSEYVDKSFASSKDLKHSMVTSKESVDDVTTAYDFVTNFRKEQEIPKQNIVKKGNCAKFDSKGFRILKDQVDDLSHCTRDEILNILKQNVLYSDNDLLILNKPYNIIMHESQTTKYPCLSTYLDEFAREIDQQTSDPKLFTVHRLDRETTGCLLLARNEIMAMNLKSLLAQRKIIKKYWVLTSKVPDPLEGIIDIPIAEGSINNKKRMVLDPHIPKDIEYRNHSRKGKQAVTSYKVLSTSGNAAFVEVTPQTGIKHQIRVHFGFGLSCPIIGDHKYSHLDKLAPQKLPSDILQRLHVRQSKVRYIPTHIHAESITIPDYFEGRNLFVNAPLPDHMKHNLKSLKFKK